MERATGTVRMAILAIVLGVAFLLWNRSGKGACEDVPASAELSQEQCQEIKLRVMGFSADEARQIVKRKQGTAATNSTGAR